VVVEVAQQQKHQASLIGFYIGRPQLPQVNLHDLVSIPSVYYCTPHVLQVKRNELRSAKERLESGVDKIAQASAQVADLQKALKEEQIIVEEKKAQTDELIVSIGREKAVVDEAVEVGGGGGLAKWQTTGQFFMGWYLQSPASAAVPGSPVC
jgi:hypothetical protein